MDMSGKTQVLRQSFRLDGSSVRVRLYSRGKEDRRGKAHYWYFSADVLKLANEGSANTIGDMEINEEELVLNNLIAVVE